MGEYENILEEIRAFGPFQIRLFVLVSLFETPLAWAMLVPIFTAANPGFFCSETSSGGFDFNSTQDDDVCQRNETSCTEISAHTEFTSIVTEWRLICDLDYVGELITSLQMVGVGIGAFITGQLADIFGRKKILFIEYALLLIFWFSTAFANSWQVYAALRVMVGGLVGGCLVVNFVLPLEFVSPKWRTFCGCIGFWAVGLMTLAPWAYFLRDWRKLNIAMSCCGIILLFLWWFIDESPRWLLIKGRFKEAEDIIARAAHFNKRPVPKLDGLQEFVRREQMLQETRKKYSYYHLFSSVNLAVGTAICMFGWFVSSAVYYGHNFNSKNLAGNRYLNVFLSGIVEIPALLLLVLINNKLGRRWTSALYMLISGLASFSILIIDRTAGLEEMSALTLTCALIGKSFIAGGWAAVQIFSAETFPTVIRNIGIASCSIAARIGGIVAPQFVYLGHTSKVLPFTIFGCLALLCSLLLLVLNETRGMPLPDSLHQGSKQDKNSVILEDTEKPLVHKVLVNGHGCGQDDGKL